MQISYAVRHEEPNTIANRMNVSGKESPGEDSAEGQSSAEDREWTDGQRVALGELREVAVASKGSMQLGGRTLNERGSVQIELLLDTSALVKTGSEKSVPLKARESVWILIPPGFPESYPSMRVTHSRFAGYENILRGEGICLFRSSDAEWEPADGMAGFVRDRVWGWFERAAKGELEYEGGILHMPVTYSSSYLPLRVIYEANEPELSQGETWLGFARFQMRSQADIERLHQRVQTAELVGWGSSSKIRGEGEFVGVAFLLPGQVGFEFPRTVAELLGSLREACGVSLRTLLKKLVKAARMSGRNEALLLTVGTPSTESHLESRRHYLTTLFLAGELTQKFWDAGHGGQSAQRRALNSLSEEMLVSDEPVLLCFPYENRSELVRRRDERTALSWFKGKRVAVWGCGALGAPIALQLARAGAREFILRDKGVVKPGLLVRQPFTESEVGSYKVDALGNRLAGINADIMVSRCADDIRETSFGPAGWTGGADLLINATASQSVKVFLDKRRTQLREDGPPVLTVGVDGRAERGYARLVTRDFAGSVSEVDRSVKMRLLSGGEDEKMAEAFFPSPDSPRSDPFYPERGCSDSTFIGSSADMAVLSGSMINWAGRELSREGTSLGGAFMMCRPDLVSAEETCYPVRMPVEGRVGYEDERSEYEVRLADGVQEQIRTHIAEAQERNGPGCETGGPLYGAWDAALGVLWVDEAGPAPTDSTEAPNRFLCGTEGLEDENELRMRQTQEASGFVGTWHTHPRSAPNPSGKDLASMDDFFKRPELLPRTFLMLIIGLSDGSFDLKPHVFFRNEFSAVAPTEHVIEV